MGDLKPFPWGRIPSVPSLVQKVYLLLNYRSLGITFKVFETWNKNADSSFCRKSVVYTPSISKNPKMMTLHSVTFIEAPHLFDTTEVKGKPQGKGLYSNHTITTDFQKLSSLGKTEQQRLNSNSQVGVTSIRRTKSLIIEGR